MNDRNSIRGLFDLDDEPATTDQTRAPNKIQELDQYFTPLWAAERLIELTFPDLGPNDFVLEPTCGNGNFLRAIPAEVPAVGVEIDPEQAERARNLTGRTIVTGDFTTIPLDIRCTVAVGNPPFPLDLVDAILARTHELLTPDGRAAFVLGAYNFQTPSRVRRYSEQWTNSTSFLPRTLFKGLSMPICWAVFSKERHGRLIGFTLYDETNDVAEMPARYAEALRSASGSIWRQAVTQALIDLGGRGTTEQIYARIAPRRPSRTPWWREKVRQILQTGFNRTARGEYAIA
jgi:site-specific DNA-methyltransferase (adenine-specific)